MADCIIGIPTFGEVSIHWAMSLTSIAMPINFSNQFRIVLGKRIDEARNEIVETALKDESKPRYVFFLDDDVIMPPDTLRRLVHRMDNSPLDIGAISGVYYSKNEPGEPLIFREKGRGSDYDWKMGDFFQAWAAGCGLVLIRTEALRRMVAQRSKPWFLIDYGLAKREDGVYEARSITEDLYFYTKMAETKAPNGKPYSLWVDTSIQAKHFEKNSKKFFGLQPEEAQAQGRKPLKVKDAPKMLWVGYGGKKASFPCQTITTDSERDLNPDIVCSGDILPVSEGEFDYLYSAYLLHTFAEPERVLTEWSRVLKDGGKVHVKVPDIDFFLAKAEEEPDIALRMIYQGRVGFNKTLARKLFEKVFRDVYCFNNGSELNIMATKGGK